MFVEISNHHQRPLLNCAWQKRKIARMRVPALVALFGDDPRSLVPHMNLQKISIQFFKFGDILYSLNRI
jgi:hypothetical protein